MHVESQNRNAIYSHLYLQWLQPCPHVTALATRRAGRMTAPSDDGPSNWLDHNFDTRMN